MLRYLVIGLIVLFLQEGVNAQSALLKEAEKFFQYKQYDRALNAYTIYNRNKPGDENVLVKLGICHYYTGSTALAQQSLSAVLSNSKKPSPEAYLYLAKSLHADGNFLEATAQYKAFLGLVKPENNLRGHVRDAIKRCGSGIRLEYLRSNAIVENIGSAINTRNDDYAIVLSPTYEDRIYFSSVRSSNLGGMLNDQGVVDLKYGEFKSDIYAATTINGSWDLIEPLGGGLNSIQDDHVMDFSPDGQKIVLWKSINGFAGNIVIDTFSQDGDLRRGLMKGPFQGNQGDAGLTFFNDTTILFYSNRPGGYGGTDIYAAFLSGKTWSRAHNLGPEINGPYDEISPFLSEDGSVLYFASNRPSSIGGFDIFKSSFQLGRQSWNAPENLGMPINSGRDDYQIRLGSDGLKGYFTSNRPGGQGKLDVYIIYFKSYLDEQKSETIVPSLVGLSQAKQQGETALGDVDFVFDDSQIKKYSLSPLFYDVNDRIITPENLSSLQTLEKILKDNSKVTIELVGCSDLGTSAEFDLYFSIKRAEEVANFLNENGIESHRIVARGVGRSYPIVKHTINGQPVLLGKKLNRRVDFIFKNTNGLPIAIEVEQPKVNNPQFQMSGISFLANQTNGVTYRIKVAMTENMYSGRLISEYPDAMIDKPQTRKQYRYTVGLYNTFQSAQFMKNDLIKQGNINAEVVAFINGNEVDKASALPFVEQFPDLANFLVNE